MLLPTWEQLGATHPLSSVATGSSSRVVDTESRSGLVDGT